MTTQTRLKVEYTKGTARNSPKITLGFSVPFLLRLKILFSGVFWWLLTEEEIEQLSRQIVRWRLVKKLREAKIRANRR